jgi:hypothetical protein
MAFCQIEKLVDTTNIRPFQVPLACNRFGFQKRDCPGDGRSTDVLCDTCEARSEALQTINWTTKDTTLRHM